MNKFKIMKQLYILLLMPLFALSQTVSTPIYNNPFDGTTWQQKFTFPSVNSQDWAGFSNSNAGIYPMSFPNGGKITFSAGASAGTTVKFTFEKNPYPDTVPNFSVQQAIVEASTNYVVNIPAQDASHTFSSAIFYIVDKDVDVYMSGVVIERYDTDGVAITDTYYPQYDNGFDGAAYEQKFTFPSVNSQDWAGFANTNTAIYPLAFPEAGQITFSAGASADTTVKFTFEANPYPNNSPNFSVEVPITATADNYTITIPAQNANNTYNSALFYIVDKDVDVYLNDIQITSGSTPEPGGASSWDFENASEIDDWTDSEALTKTHVTTGGNPGGAIKFGGTNPADAAPPALLLTHDNNNFDWKSAATAKLKFDLKIETALSSTAIHLLHETEGQAAGNVFDLQATNKGVDNTTLNETAWTSYEIDLTLSGAASGKLKIEINFAAGAIQGAGGELLMDNFVIELYDGSGNVLSINDLSDNTFMIYPNPFENTLNVSAAATIDAVSIFDLTGRQVLRATPNAAAFTLDVADLNKGMYLVSLKSGDQEMTTKLVK